MKEISQRELKEKYPTVQDRSQELSTSMWSKAMRAHYRVESFIHPGTEHVQRAFDSVRIPDSSAQIFFCVESSTAGGVGHIGKSKVFLFDDELEFEQARAEWASRDKSPTQ